MKEELESLLNSTEKDDHEPLKENLGGSLSIQQKKKPMTPAQEAKMRDEEFLSLDAKEILDLDYNKVFKDRLYEFIALYRDYDFLTEETIENFINKSDIDITLSIENEGDIEIFNDQIDKIQRAKDEFMPILNKAYRDYKFVTRWFEHFHAVWSGKFSRLSSDKKREGEAEFILGFMIKDMIRCDAMYENAKSIFKNLLDKYEEVSRKITVIQEVFKIFGDIQRPLDAKNIQKRKQIPQKIGTKSDKLSVPSDSNEVDWGKDF